MINFVYDAKNSETFIPNLVKDTTLIPDTTEWYQLAHKFPFSQENRLIKYMNLDGVARQEMLVSDLPANEIGYYFIDLNFFDTTIDYFSLMEKRSRKYLKSGRIKVVFYYGEGDNLDLEIIPHLTNLITAHGIPETGVKFVSANALSVNYGTAFVYFPDHELHYRYLHKYQADYVTSVNQDIREKKFTFLNRLDKPWRKTFAASLWQHGLQHEGYFEYMNQPRDYKTGIGDDPFTWNKYWSDVETLVAQFDLFTPVVCDEMSDFDHSIIYKPFFENAYWNFVMETHFSDDTLLLTEKTFRCILNMQPFVIMGNPGSIQLLQSMGYKTFNDYVYEDYDVIKNNERRLHQCFTECYKLGSYTDESHAKVMEEITPILEHNQRVFLSSKADRINNLIDQLQR